MLAEYLPEFPADELPFSEACRLLLNRGMGLLLAGEKIADNSADTDFILRNINKAILGACDAFLIAEHKYQWHIEERLAEINNSGLSADCKRLYAQAVKFKRTPNREVTQDLKDLWQSVCGVFKECMTLSCGKDIYIKCQLESEVSLKNFIKYCIKSRSLPLANWKRHTMPPVAILAERVYQELGNTPDKAVEQSKLYQQWLIFN